MKKQNLKFDSSLRKISVFDRTKTSCPKLLDLWVHNSKWNAQSRQIVKTLYKTVEVLHSIKNEDLYYEIT